jgi:hypothetical protein
MSKKNVHTNTLETEKANDKMLTFDES